MTATMQQTDAEQFTRQWREWHTQHEARIGDRHGFLAVTSINWLGETPQRFEDAPGEWSTDVTGVHVAPSAPRDASTLRGLLGPCRPANRYAAAGAA
jgi:uncharacterized protein (DUF1684 family)